MSSDKPQVRTSQAGMSRLLDREAPLAYIEECTERVASETGKAEGEIRTILIFRVGTEWLGLPAHLLDEIGERRRIHGIPHRRDGALAGLTSVRGELLLCFSLEKLLGLEETSGDHEKTGIESGRMIVLARDKNRVAFPVSEVHGLHRYYTREIRALPATLSQTANHLTGILPWRENLVGCLDEDSLFRALEGELS